MEGDTSAAGLLSRNCYETGATEFQKCSARYGHRIADIDSGDNRRPTGTLFISAEEHQPGYRLECLFEFLDRRAEPAPFPPSPPPPLVIGARPPPPRPGFSQTP